MASEYWFWKEYVAGKSEWKNKCLEPPKSECAVSVRAVRSVRKYDAERSKRKTHTTDPSGQEIFLLLCQGNRNSLKKAIRKTSLCLELRGAIWSGCLKKVEQSTFGNNTFEITLLKSTLKKTLLENTFLTITFVKYTCLKKKKHC